VRRRHKESTIQIAGYTKLSGDFLVATALWALSKNVAQ
jgi:hypothetical protein